jgi:glycosyltransferase involved in cell wall biosynthesis
MRILHLIATNFYGGPERQIVRHCVKARDLGYECVIGTFVDGAQQNELVSRATDRGIEVRAIRARSAYDPSVLSTLRTLMKECTPSMVCTHGYRAAILGVPLSRFLGVPVVSWSRGWTKENLKIRIWEALDKLLIRFADCVVAVSGEQKWRLVRCGIPASKVHVVPNALDAPEVQESAGRSRLDVFEEFAIPAGYKVIGTGGRLSPEKGHVFLIEAMAEVLKKRSDIFLLILGDGELRNKLMDLAKRVGLNGRVAFPGFRQDFYQILMHLDVFVLPSLTEGLSNVILEAFAAQKPVVATAVGGNPELVHHMETGYLVPPRDPTKMAEAIAFLISNPAIARDMAKGASCLLESEFSLEIQTQRICKIYSDVSGG